MLCNLCVIYKINNRKQLAILSNTTIKIHTSNKIVYFVNSFVFLVVEKYKMYQKIPENIHTFAITLKSITI